jgi:hypothetical protein
MDHSSTFLLQHLYTVLYVAGILTYGIRQYLKREKAHRALIRSLLAGEGAIEASPIEEPKSVLYLIEIVAIEILALAGIIWVVYMQPRILYGRDVMYIIAMFLIAWFALLLPVLIREIRRYRAHKAL